MTVEITYAGAPDARQLRAWLTPITGAAHAAELAVAENAQPPLTSAWDSDASDTSG